jgi:Flp pilus assembly protein TadD
LTAALGLAAGLLLAGTWAWDRETRHAETAAGAVAAEADQLRDADRVPEALQAARRAADLLPRFGRDAALRHEIKQQVADLQLLNRLEEARLERAYIRPDDKKLAEKKLLSLFQKAFQEYGVDVIGGDEPAVIAALQRRAIVAQVTAALSQWEVHAPNPVEKQRLGRLADAIDPDPRHLVSQIRRATNAKDVDALKRLTVDARAELPPPEIIGRLGSALHEVSAFEEEARLLRAGQQRYPAAFFVINELGCALGLLGSTHIDEEIGCFRTALALRPMSSSVWMNLGNALDRAGRHDEAEEAYRRSIALDPNSPRTHNNLGNFLTNQGRNAQAEAEFRRAIALTDDLKDDTNHDAHNHLGAVLAQQGRFAEAEAAFRRAIELAPNVHFAHFNLSILLDKMGRHAEAVAALRRVIEIKPNYAEAHNRLGLLLQSQRPKEAEAAYRRAIELKPDYADAHNNLGVVLKQQGRPAEAEAAFRRAIKLEPDDANAHCNLGDILLRQERFSEAVEEWRRGHELGSKQKNWSYPSA